MIGSRVGSYRVVARLGEDGLGVVYAARDEETGWQATLRHLARPYADPTRVASAFRVARAAADTGHTGIARVFECMTADADAFVAWEHLEGEALARALARDRRLWPQLAVQLAWQLATALGTAHNSGVVHGLLRPACVHLSPDAKWPGGFHARVLDFGFSVYLGDGAPNWRDPRVEGLGLPLYLAPERCQGARLDALSDVYSLGCVLYHMLCGRPPFLAQSPYDLAHAHAQMPVRPPSAHEPSVLAELDALVVALLAKRPEDRPPSMAHVASELERILHARWPETIRPVMPTVQLDLRVGAPPPPRRRLRPAFVVAALVAAGGAGTFAWHQRQQDDGPAMVSLEAAPAALVAPPAPPPPAPPTEAELQLAVAHSALLDERFADAIAAAKMVLSLQPEDDAAMRLIERARAEPRVRPRYSAFRRAVKARNATEMARRWARLPADSVYRVKGLADYERLRDEWVAARVLEARTLAARGRCDRVTSLRRKVASLFPEATTQVAVVQALCAR